MGSRHYPSDEYIAGFLDGDGSIVATLERYNSKRFPYSFRVKVNFSQHAKHIKVLKLIQETLGGFGAIRINAKKNLGELVIRERTEVQTVLARLAPHVIIKKRQIILAQKVLHLLRFNKKHKPSTLSEGAYTRVLQLMQDIRNLNSRTGGKGEV